MADSIKHVKFQNIDQPRSFFEMVRIEDLLKKDLDHDIFKNHVVKFYIVLFVTHGDGYHTIDFTDYKYKKGTVLLIRQDQVHRFFQSTNVKGYLLVFTEEFLVGHLNKLEVLKSFQLFNEMLSFPKIELSTKSSHFSDVFTLIRHIESEYEIKDDFSIGITRSAFHILIIKLFRIKSYDNNLPPERKNLTEFLSFHKLVEKNCFTSKKVLDYSREMNISTKKLNHIVKSIVNKSAKAFIDEIAIMQIKRLLISTNSPVKEVAYSVGYDDTTNFFKYFRKHTGSSPEAFRKAYQQ